MPNTRHLQCRTYGHAWYETSDAKPSDKGTPFALKCERCDTIRVDYIDERDGSLAGRRYEYAEGYAKDPDDEPFTRDDFRLMIIRQRLEARRVNKRKAS